MGLRFKKSIKLGNGAKLNIGKKSVSMSTGGKDAQNAGYKPCKVCGG